MKHQTGLSALSPLQFAIRIANVSALDNSAVERHKASEAAKYPPSILWKLFDKNGMSSSFVLMVLPAMIMVAGSAVFVLGLLTHALTAIGYILYSWDEFVRMWPLLKSSAATVLGWSGCGILIGFAIPLTIIMKGITATEPAHWAEFSIADHNPSMPLFVRTRMDAIRNVGMSGVTFMLAELRQGQNLLDPILYACLEKERVAIAVWDALGNEVVLDDTH